MHDNLATFDENDPWQKKRPQQPPNLDEIFEDFGGKFFQNNNGPLFFPLLILFVVSLLWIVSGFYIVKPAQEAIVLRFGKYHATEGPGLHWIAQGLENKYVVNVNRIYTYNYSDQMLTEDENYVKASITVFYRIQSPKDFLFNVRDPEESLNDAVHSALRQTIGHTHLEEVLTSGKEVVRQDTAKLIKSILATYKTGIDVTDVKLQEATVPPSVIAAFDDVITAREAKAAKISQGERYVKKVVPLARGQSKRRLQEAQAYHDKVVLHAKADVAKFLALLPLYEKNGKLMQQRLYFDTMDSVLSRVNKIFVPDNKQILYLPIDSAARNASSRANDDIASSAVSVLSTDTLTNN